MKYQNTTTSGLSSKTKLEAQNQVFRVATNIVQPNHSPTMETTGIKMCFAGNI